MPAAARQAPRVSGPRAVRRPGRARRGDQRRHRRLLLPGGTAMHTWSVAPAQAPSCTRVAPSSTSAGSPVRRGLPPTERPVGHVDDLDAALIEDQHAGRRSDGTPGFEGAGGPADGRSHPCRVTRSVGPAQRGLELEHAELTTQPNQAMCPSATCGSPAGGVTPVRSAGATPVDVDNLAGHSQLFDSALSRAGWTASASVARPRRDSTDDPGHDTGSPGATRCRPAHTPLVVAVPVMEAGCAQGPRSIPVDRQSRRGPLATARARSTSV